MAALLHIRPWEHDLLTVWEFYRLCTVIDKTEEGSRAS